MNKIKCAVRFDDVCPTMNWEQFNRAINLMDKYNIKPLLGIIPDNRDPEQIIDDENEAFWNEMLKLQRRGYSIALHGCYHVYDNVERGMITPWEKKGTEFAGHSYENQYEKIKVGKQILESHGIQTDIFFAPAHSYDRVTLRALYDNGFRYVSDGKSKRPYMQGGIKCIPCRTFAVPKVRRNGVYIAVCHSSRWGEYPENYQRLEKFCDRYAEYMVPFEELKKWKKGWYLWEKTNEKGYLVFVDLIRRKLSKINVLAKIYQKVFG